jgi:hypothetical protein
MSAGNRCGEYVPSIQCLPSHSGPHTIAYMKDAVLTIRLPLATRRRIEVLARQEGRSLSQQAERLLERGLQARGAAAHETPTNRRRIRSLAGVLAGGRVPTLEECRQVRTLLSDSVGRREAHAGGRR